LNLGGYSLVIPFSERVKTVPQSFPLSVQLILESSPCGLTLGVVFEVTQQVILEGRRFPNLEEPIFLPILYRINQKIVKSLLHRIAETREVLKQTF
jgi:hypothetical protein